MIKGFADDATEDCWNGKRVKRFESFERQAQRRLVILSDASCIEDLMMLRSNRFEALGGKRKGQYSIRINDQWRICVRFEEGDAHDVEITDYH
jgi:proteic killer suppression protein